MSKISICIPAYEMNGNGVKSLKRLLQTISAQTYKDYEIIVSDHSKNDEIKKLTEQFNNLNLIHIYNTKNYGSNSHNTNNAIKNATFDNIKVMFQDDFFVSPDALKLISESIKNSVWGVSACIHYNSQYKNFYNPHQPHWQDNIKKGVNSLGSPSVSFFKRTEILFDERLLWFMDTDLYYQYYLKYGEPNIITQTLVAITEDPTRITNTLITQDLVNKEYSIIKEKFNFI
jgi:glycosyltransferase involved in cell wall biosynthesis